MPGKPGFYLPGMPAHVVQRGNCRQALDPELIHDVRAAVQTGTPLGNDRFREQVKLTLQCTTGHPRPGRPAKAEKGY
jgi:hypothetical protein